jgi:hypothetical protein
VDRKKESSSAEKGPVENVVSLLTTSSSSTTTVSSIPKDSALLDEAKYLTAVEHSQTVLAVEKKEVTELANGQSQPVISFRDSIFFLGGIGVTAIASWLYHSKSHS